MLKRNRKLNKQALVESSLAYGALKQGGKYRDYPVFKWLASANGAAKAVVMLKDAEGLPSFSSRCTYPAGCVIWDRTNYYSEWLAADHAFEVANQY